MRYSWIIIGAGPAGYSAAIQAAHLKQSVLLIEENEVGGTCLNVGCIPTKALVHASGMYRSLSQMESCGIHAQGTLNISEMNAYKQETVDKLRRGVEALIKGNSIQLLKGHARILKAHAVQVNDELYEADHILIATGSVPAIPPIAGIQTAEVMTSSDLLDIDAHPFQHLVIIGGGVIGMEFCSLFLNLGRKVTVIEMKDRILPEMDPEISQNLSMLLKRRGAVIRTGCSVSKLEKNRVWIGEESIDCDAILMAAGRRSRTEGLFENNLIETSHGSIVTDESFLTGLEDTYACGDCVHGIQLAHYAAACARSIIQKTVTGHSDINLNAVPACVYLNEEIACVGMSEEQAKQQGIAYRIGRYSMLGNSRSVIEKADRGFIKIISDENGVIIGACMMCLRASDLIVPLVSAVAEKQTVHSLENLIYPHPGFAEGIQEALEDTDKDAIHVLYRHL